MQISQGLESRRAIARVWGIAVACLLVTAPGYAEVPPAAKWDQARVTDIALKLRDASKALYVEALKAPDKPLGSARRAQYLGREDLRQIASMSRRLAGQLQAGKGRDETEGIYLRLQQTRRDAEEQGRRGDITEPVMAKIGPVTDLLRQIAPYYDNLEASE